LETSFGYTGVNIKIPLNKDIKTMEIKKFTFKGDNIIESFMKYSDYLKLLPEKDQQKKIKKERYNTFLVFHSGRTIYSGLSALFMRDSYYYFLEIIKASYEIIEERLDA
jgi:hypothetical protein